MKTLSENKNTRKLWILLILIIAIYCPGCDRLTSSTNNGPVVTTNENRPVTEPAPPTRTGVESYSNIVKKVSPAVVTIQSERRVRAPRQFPFLNDPRFREFFRNRFGSEAPQQPPSQVQRGIGSGVLVSSDGYVLTNHHVIDGAEAITVVLSDRQTFEAKVVGNDPPSDLAVLKIEVNDLPTLSLGNSDSVEVGDIVLAVGNPLGLQQTVTAGIISAKGRSTGISDGSFEDFLQTDAPINQGNSGGALVNTAGEVIGINSQILSPTGGNIGIGFAIPSNMARNVMQQLINTGTVKRGQLGVVVQPVTSDIARSMDLPGISGVLISRVQPDSAASRAGLRQGDVIISLNGEPVNESNDLRNRVAATPPGTTITLTVLRNGSEQQLQATLEELKPANNQ